MDTRAFFSLRPNLGSWRSIRGGSMIGVPCGAPSRNLFRPITLGQFPSLALLSLHLRSPAEQCSGAKSRSPPRIAQLRGVHIKSWMLWGRPKMGKVNSRIAQPKSSSPLSCRTADVWVLFFSSPNSSVQSKEELTPPQGGGENLLKAVQKL